MGWWIAEKGYCTCGAAFIVQNLAGRMKCLSESVLLRRNILRWFQTGMAGCVTYSENSPNPQHKMPAKIFFMHFFGNKPASISMTVSFF
jgi:hypothetical protein